MFPVSDFNFVVCGLATFAATVGYACTRSRKPGVNIATFDNTILEPNLTALKSSTSSGSMSEYKQAIPSPSTSQPSLKRKAPHDGFEADEPHLEYPHNLANIYPNKRSRTPPVEAEAKLKVAEETTDMITESEATQIQQPEIISQEVVPQLAIAECSESGPTLNETRVSSTTPDLPLTQVITPPSTPSLSHATPTPPSRTPPPQPSTPQPNASKSISVSDTNRTPLSQSSSSHRGFAAFAGSQSPFASFTSPSSSLPSYEEATSKKTKRSIWMDGSTNEERTRSNRVGIEPRLESFGMSPKPNAVKSKVPTCITGEENEQVEQELRSVKLYVKRGTKSFSVGIQGQVKLLSHKETLEERLLFRREPLWKVSMNFRVRPTVKCTFDEEDSVLRFILKEAMPIEQSISKSKSQKESASNDTEEKENKGGDKVTRNGPKDEIVVYALKPGRTCSKQEFTQFAESLMANPRFKQP